MYTVKTRNWNSNPKIAMILNSLRFLEVYSDQWDGQQDLDNKYWIQTKNHCKAWFIWLVFMACRKWSGGWTYICRPGKTIGDGYRCIY